MRNSLFLLLAVVLLFVMPIPAFGYIDACSGYDCGPQTKKGLVLKPSLLQQLLNINKLKNVPIKTVDKDKSTPNVVNELIGLDSRARAVYNSYVAGQDYKQTAIDEGVVLVGDKMMADIYLDVSPTEIRAEFEKRDMDIKVTNEDYKMLEGLVPIAKLVEFENAQHVKGIIIVTAFGTDKQ